MGKKKKEAKRRARGQVTTKLECVVCDLVAEYETEHDRVFRMFHDNPIAEGASPLGHVTRSLESAETMALPETLSLAIAIGRESGIRKIPLCRVCEADYGRRVNEDGTSGPPERDDCRPACACKCHDPDIHDPGEHLPTCLWADPDFPDRTPERRRRAKKANDAALRAALARRAK